MKKQLSIIQLSNTVLMVPQYLYKVVRKPIAGQIYDENSINYDELKKVLVKKFGSEKAVLELLEIDEFNDLEIVSSTRNQKTVSKVDLSEIEVNKNYIVKSYHHEVKVKLVNICKVNNDTLYIFEHLEESKINKDKYRVITETEFNQSRYKIIELD